MRVTSGDFAMDLKPNPRALDVSMGEVQSKEGSLAEAKKRVAG
jgi:hypothetical protein